MPTQWYNIVPDLPDAAAAAAAPRHPPAGRARRLRAAVPDGADRAGGEHRALHRHPRRGARRLPAVAARARCSAPTGSRRLLDTPASIYYKYEGVSPAGSHKPNTSVPQAYYNHQEGIRKLTTETGAGQWGSALAFARAQYGMECEVWQVAASYRTEALPPHDDGDLGRHGALRARRRSPSSAARCSPQDPDHPGTLGIAISEAVARRAADPSTRYALGTVLNHVLLHQTIIGEEALLQLAKVGETPDVLVGCTGGGSNFGGLAFPFLREKLAGRMNPTIRCVEPAACPTLTKGEYRYDFGDTAGHDAADEDAHARPRLHPRADPRRRPALPRHGAAGLARLRARAGRGDRHPADRVLRRRASSSPAPRASCRRPSRRTRSPPPSARRWPARSPARRR